MKNNPKNYTIRKRRDCNRWELFIRSKGYPIFYGGLYKSEEEAKKAFDEKWLMHKVEV
jgi:hypothetical protein